MAANRAGRPGATTRSFSQAHIYSRYIVWGFYATSGHRINDCLVDRARLMIE
jgi:hypothetical protein